ncbi:hypothetical protein L6R50_01980 [Myxococcota bacterium]|nr:hypothetical protein [Myxococcota bacterium]
MKGRIRDLPVEAVTSCGYLGGMQSVGVHDLEARLGEYLLRVRDGEVFAITDGGVVVAELRPAGGVASEGTSPVELHLRDLVRRGLAIAPAARFDPTLIAPGGSAPSPERIQEILDDERGP